MRHGHRLRAESDTQRPFEFSGDADAQIPSRYAARRAGPRHHLVKPVNPLKLLELLAGSTESCAAATLASIDDAIIAKLKSSCAKASLRGDAKTLGMAAELRIPEREVSP